MYLKYQYILLIVFFKYFGLVICKNKKIYVQFKILCCGCDVSQMAHGSSLY